jgi:hypothetical protein
MLDPVIGAPRDIRRLQERSLRVDAVLRMSTPPPHLSGRTLLPGVLLAVLVTCAALFALAVVIVVAPDGPVRLWLDGGGSATNLRPGGNADGAGAFPTGPVSLLPGGASTTLGSGITLASPVARTDRPGAVQLRSNTREQRRAAARTPAASRPNRTAPAATPLSPGSGPAASSTPAPVATAAPGSTVVKSRGRPTSPTESEVPKQRVAASPAPSSEPRSASSAPEGGSAPAPAPAPAPVQQAAPQDTGVGVADGVLHRVPTP